MNENVFKIDLVYDHKDWMLLSKPAGLNFHSEGGELGFVELAKQQFSLALWPVHRLDKPTSGLIFLAKSPESCAVLCSLFSKRNIEKYYISICQNTLNKKQGKISGDMAKSRRGTYKLLKTKENPAVTQFLSKSLAPGFRVCLLKPKTGKTHQLRVAMKSLSAPIEGDSRYGGEKSDRLYLHAFAIRFEYEGELFEFSKLPISGEKFQSELFNSAVEEWQAPWKLNWP